MQIGGKGGRSIREFDCFGPKIFGATRDPHADLRDRLIMVPFFRPDDVKILATLKTPTASSEDWNRWRGMLYSLFLTKFREVEQVARQVAEESDNGKGRCGELLRPIVAIMRFCGVDESMIKVVTEHSEQRMQEIRPTITRLDEQILMVLYNTIRGNDPKAIVEVPLSLMKTRCAESEEIGGMSYESLIYEALKRNAAFLKIQRRWGEIIMLTNVRTVLRALAKLGCVPEGALPPGGGFQQQIEIPVSPALPQSQSRSYTLQ